MKEITFFHLAGCPYCHEANQFIAELTAENPKYAAIPINRIEETENPQVANSFDYYYVPCFWIGKTKLHEGASTKEQIRKVLEAAVE